MLRSTASTLLIALLVLAVAAGSDLQAYCMAGGEEILHGRITACRVPDAEEIRRAATAAHAEAYGGRQAGIPLDEYLEQVFDDAPHWIRVTLEIDESYGVRWRGWSVNDDVDVVREHLPVTRRDFWMRAPADTCEPLRTGAARYWLGYPHCECVFPGTELPSFHLGIDSLYELPDWARRALLFNQHREERPGLRYRHRARD